HTPGRDVDDVAVAALEHPGCEPADQPQRRVVVEHHGPLDVVPAFQRLGRRMDRPALLIRMSTPPMRFSTSATNASTAAMSETSQGIDIADPPAVLIR